MAYTLNVSIALGQTETGKTLRGQLVDTTGANVGTEITTGFVEIGNGLYMASLSVPDDHSGGCKFYESGQPSNPLAFVAINPTEHEGLHVTLEGVHSVEEALRIMLAVLVGKSTGGGTSTLTFRDVADTKARVTVTVDASRNRTAVTLDGA